MPLATLVLKLGCVISASCLMLAAGIVGLSFDRAYFDQVRNFLTVSDQTCSQLCFAGINFGSSNDSQARDALAHAFNLDTLFSNDPLNLYWSGQSVSSAAIRVRAGRVIFRGETVRYIHLKTTLTLGEIQLALGQPGRILVYETNVFGAKPYLVVYPQYDLYLVVDPYLCSLNQWNLWNMSSGVNIALGDLVLVEQILPYPLTSFTELDVAAWATELRRFNYCKGRH